MPRSTPIGWINRFMWSVLPRWLSSIDRRFTGGYIGPLVSGVGNYLMNEKHPVVMVSDLSNFCLYVCNGRGLTEVLCRHSTSLLFRGDCTCLSKTAGNTSHQLTSCSPLPSPMSARNLTLFQDFCSHCQCTAVHYHVSSCQLRSWLRDPRKP